MSSHPPWAFFGDFVMIFSVHGIDPTFEPSSFELNPVVVSNGRFVRDFEAYRSGHHLGDWSVLDDVRIVRRTFRGFRA